MKKLIFLIPLVVVFLFGCSSTKQTTAQSSKDYDYSITVPDNVIPDTTIRSQSYYDNYSNYLSDESEPYTNIYINIVDPDPFYTPPYSPYLYFNWGVSYGWCYPYYPYYYSYYYPYYCGYGPYYPYHEWYPYHPYPHWGGYPHWDHHWYDSHHHGVRPYNNGYYGHRTFSAGGSYYNNRVSTYSKSRSDVSQQRYQYKSTRHTGAYKTEYNKSTPPPKYSRGGTSSYSSPMYRQAKSSREYLIPRSPSPRSTSNNSYQRSSTPQKNYSTPQRTQPTQQKNYSTPQKSYSTPQRTNNSYQRSSTPQKSYSTPQRSSSPSRSSYSSPSRSSSPSSPSRSGGGGGRSSGGRK